MDQKNWYLDYLIKIKTQISNYIIVYMGYDYSPMSNFLFS